MSTDTQFDAPAIGGETLKPDEVKGHLLIVRPLSYEQGITTAFGVRDAVRVNVVDLDTPADDGTPGKLIVGALWFSGVLVGGLKHQLGGTVLARMGQGIAKPGQSAPWKLDDATTQQADTARASTWLSAHPGALDGLTPPAVTAPAPAAAAATPAPTTPTVSPEALAALAALTPEQKAALGIPT